MAGHVSDAVIRRLPGYYRHLRELESAGVEQISSQELGERMHLTPSQIRQDINCFGGFGRQGYGYKVSDLKMHIGEILGLDREHTEIIVGAGPFTTAVKREKILGIFPARLHKTKKCATIRLIFLSHEGIGRKCPKITNALEENEDGRACV